MTGYTNVGGGGNPVKSAVFKYTKGQAYPRPNQTQFIDTAHYNSYPSHISSNRDNIQVDVGQITRWFCDVITYEGQVLGYKVNGIYYPIFYMKPKGFSLILRDIFSTPVIQLIHTFYNQQIAMMIDSATNKVYIGGSSYTDRNDWTPDKDYEVEIFYMEDPK